MSASWSRQEGPPSRHNRHTPPGMGGVKGRASDERSELAFDADQPRWQPTARLHYTATHSVSITRRQHTTTLPPRELGSLEGTTLSA